MSDMVLHSFAQTQHPLVKVKFLTVNCFYECFVETRTKASRSLCELEIKWLEETPHDCTIKILSMNVGRSDSAQENFIATRTLFSFVLFVLTSLWLNNSNNNSFQDSQCAIC